MSIRFFDDVRVSPLFQGIAKGWYLLTRAERKQMAVLWGMTMADGLFKAFSLAAIFPFVMIVVDPDRFLNHPRFKDVVDWTGIKEPTDILVMTGILLIGVVLLKNVFSWFTMRAEYTYCAYCESRLSEEMLGRVLRAPLAWSSQHSSHRLRVIIKDHVHNWAVPFQHALLKLVNDVVFTVTMMSILIYASPGAGALVSFLAIILGLFLFRGIRPVILRLADTIRAAKIEATILGSHAIVGVKDIKMTGTEEFFLHAFTSKILTMALDHSRSKLWQRIPGMTIEVVIYGALITMIVIALARGVTPTELAAVGTLYAIAALRLMPVLSSVVSSFGAILDTMPLIEEIQQIILETEEEDDEGNGPVDEDQFSTWQKLSAGTLGYTYATGKQAALDNVNLKIEFGKIYGLAGPSGSGKSTLIDILSGLLEPQHGAVEIDGCRLDNDRLQSWRFHTGYVSQSPFMLDATLRENIAFGLPADAVDEQRLNHAVKLSNLTEVVKDLPDGLATQIGESALRLSGGERQRVAIARAIYQNVRLLIFDEATSALDNLNEREIRNTIAGIAGKVTIILVAHRISTIIGCHKIFVLNNGRLAGEGAYRKLVADCPIFAKMAEVEAPFDSLPQESNAGPPVNKTVKS